MTELVTLLRAVPGLTEPVFRHYLAQGWIRPAQHDGAPVFDETDVARVRLVFELHTKLEVEEPSLPVLLSLLDQLHATRHQLRQVLDALDPAVKTALAERLEPNPVESAPGSG